MHAYMYAYTLPISVLQEITPDRHRKINKICVFLYIHIKVKNFNTYSDLQFPSPLLILYRVPTCLSYTVIVERATLYIELAPSQHSR